MTLGSHTLLLALLGHEGTVTEIWPEGVAAMPAFCEDAVLQLYQGSCHEGLGLGNTCAGVETRSYSTALLILLGEGRTPSSPTLSQHQSRQWFGACCLHTSLLVCGYGE